MRLRKITAKALIARQDIFSPAVFTSLENGAREHLVMMPQQEHGGGLNASLDAEREVSCL